MGKTNMLVLGRYYFLILRETQRDAMPYYQTVSVILSSFYLDVF